MATGILRFGLLGAVWLGGLGVSCAPAAVFLLANGGQIEGELLNAVQEPRVDYVVQLPGGGRIRLDKAQVTSVLAISDELRWYEQWAPKVPNTVDGHWAMAEQCRDRNLKAQRVHHLNQVLRLDPNHNEARRGLGYHQVAGRWIKTDEWMQQQGYVRYRGAWRTPQDVALEKAAEQRDKSEKSWAQNIRTWRTWVLKARGREQQALEALRAIDDPAAAPGLVEIVENEQDPRELRLLCVELLGRLGSPAAVKAFIDRAVNDRDAHVREACLDQLRRSGAVQARRAFEALLGSPDNNKVRRAGACLGALGEPEATLPLIEALVTEHKFLIQTGGSPGQMNLGFGSGPGGGGNSFGVGGRPKIVRQRLTNESVLNALVALWPGVNFGYDQEAWRAWYASRRTPGELNLRRDY